MSKLPNPKHVLLNVINEDDVYWDSINGDDAIKAMKEYGKQIRNITLEYAAKKALTKGHYTGINDEPDYEEVDKNSILKLKRSKALAIK